MKDIIVTDGAPMPVGPYSQAVRANGFLFSVQIALDPNTNTFLEGDVAQQTERTLENLKAILMHAGLTLSNVVKTTVFLKDMSDFAAMNEVYGNERSIRKVFRDSRPGAFDRAGRWATGRRAGRD